jgi:hypothetical protein
MIFLDRAPFCGDFRGIFAELIKIEHTAQEVSGRFMATKRQSPGTIPEWIVFPQ